MYRHIKGQTIRAQAQIEMMDMAAETEAVVEVAVVVEADLAVA
jgi:hypothetical protein